MAPVEVSLPDWPYGSLMLILFAEAAAAFEELTLSGAWTTAEGAGAGRVAESVPRGAVPVSRGFRAGRSLAPQSGDGDGAHLLAGRSCCSCRRCATRC